MEAPNTIKTNGFLTICLVTLFALGVPLWTPLGSLGHLLGPRWRPLGPPWASLGPFRASSGPPLAAFGGSPDPSWSSLDFSWRSFGPFLTSFLFSVNHLGSLGSSTDGQEDRNTLKTNGFLTISPCHLSHFRSRFGPLWTLGPLGPVLALSEPFGALLGSS